MLTRVKNVFGRVEKWGEVAVHISIAFAVNTTLIGYLGLDPVVSAFLILIGFTVWEVRQGVRDGKGWVPWGQGWGWQKRSEWFFPAVTGFFMIPMGLGTC